MSWLKERVQQDRVPDGVITRAVQVLTPRAERRALAIDVHTRLETNRGTFESRDTARWAHGDFTGV